MLIESSMISAEWVTPLYGGTVEEEVREVREGEGDPKGLEYPGEPRKWRFLSWSSTLLESAM
jgi:hypothetical protein